MGIDSDRADGLAKDRSFVVSGAVVDTRGAPLANAHVVAIGRELRQEVVLGETESDLLGSYSVTYSVSSDTKGPDLLVRVLGDEAKILGSSTTVYGAGPEERIDVVLEASALPSEFERLVAACTPLLGEVQPADLKDDELPYVASKIGWDPVLLTVLVRASAASRESQCPPELFYACARQGLPVDLASLLELPVESIIAALEEAAARGVVPAAVSQDKQSLGRLRELAVGRLLEADDAETESVGPLLKVAVTEPEQQRKVAELWNGRRLFDERFFQSLAEDDDLDAASIAKLQRAVGVAKLVGTNAPVIAAALEHMGDGEKGIEDLAKLDATGWQDLIREVGARVPEDVPGDDDGERFQFYAESLARSVEMAYPQAVVKARLPASAVPAGAKLASALEGTTIDLASANLEVALAGVEDEEVSQGLRKLTNLYRVTPRFSQIEPLLAQGFDSAYAISQTDPAQFVQQFAPTVGGEMQALVLHRRAVEVNANALAFLARYRLDANQQAPAGVGAPGPAGEVAPEWRALFGSLDFCDCPHCRSVLSPAAYLVDLLHFLARTGGVGPGVNRPLQVLLSRRPDLADLELTCANTNTELPTIDLINELLENAVVPGTLPTASRRSREELAVQPEYVNDAAYAELTRRSYPWVLPLDRPWEELRLHLERLGIPRSRLIAALRSQTARPAQAAELLDISPAEWRLLTGQDGRLPNEAWGLGSDWVEVLRECRELLRRSGVPFEELQALLRTRFIGLGGSPPHLEPPDSCDLDAVTVAGLGEARLMRLSGFLRLRRRLGWSITDLDGVLRALDARTLDESVLLRLADVRWLQRELRVPLSELAAWWFPLATGSPPSGGLSPYERVFCDPARTSPVDPGLQLDARGRPRADGEPLADHAQALRAALELTGTELAELLAVHRAERLSLKTLTSLYREISLTRALGWRLRDSRSLLRPSGLDVFAEGDPTDARRLVEIVRRLGRWNMTAAELDELLAARRPETGLVPESSHLDAVLVGLKRDLLRVRSDSRVDPNVDDNTVAQLVGRLVAPEQVDRLLPLFQAVHAASGPGNERLISELLPQLRPTPSAFRKLLGAGAGPRHDRLAFALRRSASSALLAQRLAETLGADETTVAATLEHLRVSGDARRRVALEVLDDDGFLDGPLIGADRIDPATSLLQRRAVRQVAKALAAIRRLVIPAADVPLVCGAGPDSWLDFGTLPVSTGSDDPSGDPAHFDKWAAAADFFSTRRSRQRPGTDWSQVVRAAAGGEAAGALTALAGSILALEVDVVRRLAASTGLGLTNASWRSGQALMLLDQAAELLAELGTSLETAATLVSEHVTPAAAAAAVHALRARFEGSQWHDVERPLRDLLRERQRDALVGALHASFPDVERLSDRLLIDVQTSACQVTSRIQAAIASVQLFIHRCLTGLEPQAFLDAERARDWRWMRTYRVWEANRKVFLYPENYLHPELRDDKSPFFRELEDQLSQDELDGVRVEAAYSRYLEQLDRVARLEIVGLYHEQELRPSIEVDRVHVVGCSAGQPREYWYRRLEDQLRWTAWEKIDLDIDADQVVLTVAEGRLYLCWPIFEEEAEPASPQGWPRLPPPAPPPPRRHLMVTLAYSQRKRDGWSERRTSSGRLRADRVFLAPPAAADAVELLRQALPRIFGGRGRDPAFPGIDVLFREIGQATGETFYEIPDHREVRLVAQPVVDHPPEVDLVVRVYVRRRHPERDIAIAVGEFRLGGCHGTFDPVQFATPTRPALLTTIDSRVTAPGLESTAVHNPDPDGFGYFVSFMDEGEAFPPAVEPERARRTLEHTRSEFPVLHRAAPTPYRLALPHGGQFFFTGPLVFADDAHQFFVRPVQRPVAQTHVLKPIPAAAVNVRADVALAHQTGAGKNGDGNGYREWGTISNLSANLASMLYANGSQVLEQAGKEAEAPLARAESWNHTPFLNLEPARQRRFLFELFEHPDVCRFMIALRRRGVAGLLRRTMQLPEAPEAYRLAGTRAPLDFAGEYRPEPIVTTPYPSDRVDFEPGGAYSLYNWELFVHAPLLIAKRLHGDQKFEDAQQWFHYLFNPTAQGGDPAPKRYWNVQRFYETASTDPIDELREILSRPASDSDDATVPGLVRLVAEWRSHPFKPWGVARLRRTAVQKAVVMSYLDLLLDWADSLLRQYTRETVGEAALLYGRAATVLGERPTRLPVRESTVRSYAGLAPHLDAFTNAVVRVEATLPAMPRAGTSPSDASALRALGTTFYFCVLPNERLLGYWDRVSDRLFKIRHCQDIDGQRREMPLFEPAIDPDLLVRAVAAGADLRTLGAQAPLVRYRFPLLLAKALEVCAEVRALGGAILAAMERRDGEQLARLRSTHELATLDKMRDVRLAQISEAQNAKAALARGEELLLFRRQHYAELVAKGLSLSEHVQLGLLWASLPLHGVAAYLQVGAVIAHTIPRAQTGAAGIAAPVVTASYGGENIANALQAAAGALGTAASGLSTGSSIAAIIAGHDRRLQEWQLQIALADHEHRQLRAQMAAADVRIAIANKELEIHDQRARQAADEDQVLRSKFTNTELYAWMVNQLAATYFSAYQLALEAARRAEQAYRFERAETTARFVGGTAWDSLHKGLLAAERLQLDLRRMEAAHLTGARREHELTKHISVALLDPLALQRLRTHGRCALELPEWLFDFDHPGHYLRRIKSVAVTLPAVVGPYTSVNCRLKLESSRVRVSTALDGGRYLPQPDIATDRLGRFRSDLGSVESIATSRGQSDTGLFEPSLRDERYLPFEGAGVISRWQIELDPRCNDFDLDTLADVVLELRYTARDGGDDLRRACIEDLLTAGSPEPGTRGFSARTEFADAWHAFLYPATNEPTQTLELPLGADRYPYRARQGDLDVTGVHIVLALSETARSTFPGGGLVVRVAPPDGTVLVPDGPGPADGLTIRLNGDPATAPPRDAPRPQPIAGVFKGGLNQRPGVWRVTFPQEAIRRLDERWLAPMRAGEPRRLSADAVRDVIVFTQFRARPPRGA